MGAIRRLTEVALPMSVVQATDQTSCGHAGMQQGRSDTCGLCSGGDEDRRDILIAGWRVRIERRYSPPAMAARANGPPG